MIRSIITVFVFLNLLGVGRAADRTLAYLPLSIEGHGIGEGGPTTRCDDAAAMKSAITPDVAAGTSPDSAWSAYMRLWKAHSDAPENATIRGFFSLPSQQATTISVRRGRSSPKYLNWRGGTFDVIQTPHFEILSRVDAESAKTIAADLESIYWVWTQAYFPFWSGSDQVGVYLSDWPADEPADQRLRRDRGFVRLSAAVRHRVVLLPDAVSYLATIRQRGLAMDDRAASASTGFYSDSLRTSFFYLQSDASSRRHEIAHQLFREATDNTLGRKNAGQDADLWLVEGVAGHFESLRLGDRVATLGGWDSDRLQYARFRFLIAGYSLGREEDLRGGRDALNESNDLGLWYARAIARTHYLLDGDDFQRRRHFFEQLKRTYAIRGDRPEAPSDQSPIGTTEAVHRFLLIDDEHLIQHPLMRDPVSVCLAACPVTTTGVNALPAMSGLRWFDVSRLPADTADIQRIVADVAQLEQLSLEGCPITPEISEWLSKANQLEELDLSMTAINDASLSRLGTLSKLKTLWLTGSEVTNDAVDALLALPSLETLDVQRTAIDESGLERLRQSSKPLKLNPLSLP